MKKKHRQKIFTTLLSLLLLSFLAIRAQWHGSSLFTQVLPSYTNQVVTTSTPVVASVGRPHHLLPAAGGFKRFSVRQGEGLRQGPFRAVF